MSKQMQKEKIVPKKKTKRQDVLVLDAMNYYIIGTGLAIIFAGYFALSASPWDNPIALTLAPILLVIGYCIVIPFGIIYKKKKTAAPENTPTGE